eukprot:jgi/Psemu1/35641/gm1.35641_g
MFQTINNLGIVQTFQELKQKSFDGTQYVIPATVIDGNDIEDIDSDRVNMEWRSSKRRNFL